MHLFTRAQGELTGPPSSNLWTLIRWGDLTHISPQKPELGTSLPSMTGDEPEHPSGVHCSHQKR